MGRFLFLISVLAVLGLSGGMFFAGWQKTQSDRDSSIPAKREVLASPVVRKCVNMGGALEAPREGDWGYTIEKSDFNKLKRAGFDSVRIPIKWSAHTEKSAPYQLDGPFAQRIDQVVTEALEADLKVIINVHHYDEINEKSEAHIPRLYAIWDQIIARYKNRSNKLIYEFLNEPHTDVTPARVNKINRDLLQKVRASDPDRWVILGGGDWGTLDGLLKTNPPYDSRAMVTFHYYSPFEFTHQGAPWAHKKIAMGQTWGTTADRKAIAEDMSRAARWRDKVGMPLLLGEFGVYTKVPDAQRAIWTNAVRQSAESVGFGWCYWDYATSLAMYDQETATFRPGMLRALVGE